MAYIGPTPVTCNKCGIHFVEETECSAGALRLLDRIRAGTVLCDACSRAESPDDPEMYRAAGFETTCLLVTPDFKEISAELIEYFASHPDELQVLDWRRFEELLEAVFRNQGYMTELGPGRGDAGVDLRLIRKDSIGEMLTLVQAKRYRSGNPIELEAVQALSAAVDNERANRGLFVTTSRYLPAAQRFAQAQRRRIELANSNDVGRWCALASRARRDAGPSGGPTGPPTGSPNPSIERTASSVLRTPPAAAHVERSAPKHRQGTR